MVLPSPSTYPNFPLDMIIIPIFHTLSLVPSGLFFPGNKKKFKPSPNVFSTMKIWFCLEDIDSPSPSSGICPFTRSLLILKGVSIFPLLFCKSIVFPYKVSTISSAILSPNKLYPSFLGSSSSSGMSYRSLGTLHLFPKPTAPPSLSLHSSHPSAHADLSSWLLTHPCDNLLISLWTQVLSHLYKRIPNHFLTSRKCRDLIPPFY